MACSVLRGLLLFLLSLNACASECLDDATRIVDKLIPMAEKLGQVSLKRVTISSGIYTTVVGQNTDAYAEYSRGKIYLYAPFCRQPESVRVQILAHELGHAIDDGRGVLDGMSWGMAGTITPWERRQNEISANQWMEKIIEVIRGGAGH